MNVDLAACRDDLIALTKTHSDARVCHRAHLLLALIFLGSLRAVHAATGCGEKNLAKWRDRYLAEGGDGLRDRPRRGRQRFIDAAGDQVLKTALALTPMDYGYPTAIWGLVDVQHLLKVKCEIEIGTEALSRHLKQLGYVYRRPSLDLHHRQNLDAVESCRYTLQNLQKRGLIEVDPACSSWMKRISTPTQSWRKYGDVVVLPPTFLQQGSTAEQASSARWIMRPDS